MRTNLIRASGCLGLVFVFGCSDSPVSFEVNDLAEARALWVESEPTHYAYTFEHTCFWCDGSTVRVEVVGGEVVSRTRMGGGLIEQAPALTVDEMFDMVAEWQAGEPFWAEFRFNKRWGFPSDAAVNPEEGVFDNFQGFRVRNFVDLSPFASPP